MRIQTINNIKSLSGIKQSRNSKKSTLNTNNISHKGKFNDVMYEAVNKDLPRNFDVSIISIDLYKALLRDKGIDPYEAHYLKLNDWFMSWPLQLLRELSFKYRYVEKSIRNLIAQSEKGPVEIERNGDNVLYITNEGVNNPLESLFHSEQRRTDMGYKFLSPEGAFSVRTDDKQIICEQENYFGRRWRTNFYHRGLLDDSNRIKLKTGDITSPLNIW